MRSAAIATHRDLGNRWAAVIFMAAAVAAQGQVATNLTALGSNATVDSHNAYEIEAFLQCHDGCAGNFRSFKLWPPSKSSSVCWLLVACG